MALQTLNLITLLFFFVSLAQGQVGIGTSSPEASARLQVDANSSTNAKGFLAPRVTSTVRDNITTPAPGLLVYQTDGTAGFYYYNGTAWVRLIVSADNAANVTGTVAVANGGTGLSNLDHGLIPFGYGTSAFGSSGDLKWNVPAAALGIGVSNPGNDFGSKLDIQGNATFRTHGANRALIIDGDANYARIFTGAVSGTPADLVLGTYASGTQNHFNQVFLKQSNGFVGIRNSNPATALDVDGAVTATSIASPSITGGSGTTQSVTYKTTTGVGASGADHIFQVGNNGATEAMRITNGGNVGIGTTAPTAGLEILTDGSQLNALRVTSNQAYSSSPDAGIGFQFKYNTAGTYTSGAVISGIKENTTDGNQSGSLRFMTNSAGTIAERMRISSSGNMGIGTTSPGSRFHVKSNGSIMRIEGTDHAYFEIFPQGGSTRYGYIGYPVEGSNNLFISNENSSGNLVLSTSNTERLRILSTGQVGIGRSPSTSYILDLNGDMRANSTVYTSDARLKTVLNTWSNDDQIDFVQYRWNTAKDNREHYGYLAQDVQKVLPDAVYADSEGMMAVNYDEVHSYKLALQEKRIKELEQTVDELKKIIKRKRSRRKA